MALNEDSLFVLFLCYSLSQVPKESAVRRAFDGIAEFQVRRFWHADVRSTTRTCPPPEQRVRHEHSVLFSQQVLVP